MTATLLTQPAGLVRAWVPSVAEPRPDDLEALSSDDLLSLMAHLEEVKARADLLALAATRLFAQRLTAQAREKAGPDASATSVELALVEARNLAADEIGIVTGIGSRDCAARVWFAAAEPLRTTRLRRAMRTEGCSGGALARSLTRRLQRMPPPPT